MCLVTFSIASHLVCTPLIPACWLHTVRVVPKKRTLVSVCGAVYDQRLSLKGMFSSHLILLISFRIDLDAPDSQKGKEAALWSSVGTSC